MIAICPNCHTLYEAASEEDAYDPFRMCGDCFKSGAPSPRNQNFEDRMARMYQP